LRPAMSGTSRPRPSSAPMRSTPTPSTESAPWASGPPTEPRMFSVAPEWV
jgi:hypothetical protein